MLAYVTKKMYLCTENEEMEIHSARLVYAALWQ